MDLSAILILILFIILVGIIFYLVLQLKSLSKKNTSLSSVNEVLVKANEQLTDSNKNLVDEGVRVSREKEDLLDENYDLTTLNDLYHNFTKEIYAVLENDIEFLKGSLAKKLSLDIPEVRDLNQGLTRFGNNISQFKEAIDRITETRNE